MKTHLASALNTGSQMARQYDIKSEEYRWIALCSLGLILLLMPWTASYGQDQNHANAAEALKTGDYTNAITIAKQLVKESESDKEAWYLLGSAYLKVKKNKDAVKCLEKAVSLAPTDDEFLLGLAFAYMTV